MSGMELFGYLLVWGMGSLVGFAVGFVVRGRIK